MSELLVAALKIGFLALLWIFVLIVANVIRTDLFGHAVPAEALAHPTALAKAERRKRSRRGDPRALRVAEGRQAGLEIPLVGTIAIGRSPDSTLVLDDDYCSANHAAVRPGEKSGWVVEDFGSTNGTSVNGKRITQPTPFGPDDEVRIGRTTMRLVR